MLAQKALAVVPAAGYTFSGLLFRHFLFVHMFFYIYPRAWPLCHAVENLEFFVLTN